MTWSITNAIDVCAPVRHYVEAAIESDGSPPSSGHVGLSLELLQFQLFSLVGVAPEEQTLLTSEGELLSLSDASAQLLVRRDERRPRLFLLSAFSTSPAPDLPADWSQICTKSAFGDVPVVQPAFQSLDSTSTPRLICRACAQTCTTCAYIVCAVSLFPCCMLLTRVLWVCRSVCLCGECSCSPRVTTGLEQLGRSQRAVHLGSRGRRR